MQRAGVILPVVVLALAGSARSAQLAPEPTGGVVRVSCLPASEPGAVVCRPQTRDARLFGRLGFLAGLHLGGAISSTGSLSASHSLNVFGKVMNTALSVSYGPNGYYQGPGHQGGRPPLNPVGPGFGYQDDPASPGTTASPDKGHEASAFLGIATETRAPSVHVATEAKSNSSSAWGSAGVQDNGQQVAAKVDNDATVDLYHDNHAPQRAKNPVGVIAADAPVHEEPQETINSVSAPEEVIGEEPEPDTSSPGVLFSSERRAQLESLAKVRLPTKEEQRRLFLQHHNKHVATFNQHHAKYNGDVSRVALVSRS